MELEIKTKNSFNTDLGVRCVCGKRNSKYICPYCKTPYCSKACFHSHNANCSELFYKKQCEQALKNKKASKQDRKTMLEILDNIQHQDSPVLDEIITERQEKRLREIADLIDCDDAINKLSLQEQQQFAEAITSGELNKYIEIWNPWWVSDDNPANLSVLDPGIPLDQKYSELPAISTLTSKEPSSELIFHIVNLVWSYAYTLRTFNGDIEYNESEIMSYLLNTCSAFKTNIEIRSLQEAIEKGVSSCSQFDRERVLGLRKVIISDVGKIIRHKYNVIKLLFETYDFLHMREIALWFDNIKQDKKLKQIRRKVFFYLCYIKYKSDEYFHDLFREYTEYYQVLNYSLE